MPSFCQILHGIFQDSAGIIIQICFKIFIQHNRVGYITINNSCNIMSDTIADRIDAAFIDILA